MSCKDGLYWHTNYLTNALHRTILSGAINPEDWYLFITGMQGMYLGLQYSQFQLFRNVLFYSKNYKARSQILCSVEPSSVLCSVKLQKIFENLKNHKHILSKIILIKKSFCRNKLMLRV